MGVLFFLLTILVVGCKAQRNIQLPSPRDFTGGETEPPLPPQEFVEGETEPPRDFVEGETEPPLPPQDFVEGETEPPRPPQDFVEGGTEPPRPPQDFVEDGTEPPLPSGDFMEVGTESPLPPQDFVEGETEPSRPSQDFVEDGTEPPLPPQDFVEGETEPPRSPRDFVEGETEPPLPPQEFVEDGTEPPLPPGDFVEGETQPPGDFMEDGTQPPTQDFMEGETEPPLPPRYVMEGGTQPPPQSDFTEGEQLFEPTGRHTGNVGGGTDAPSEFTDGSGPSSTGEPRPNCSAKHDAYRRCMHPEHLLSNLSSAVLNAVKMGRCAPKAIPCMSEIINATNQTIGQHGMQCMMREFNRSYVDRRPSEHACYKRMNSVFNNGNAFPIHEFDFDDVLRKANEIKMMVLQQLQGRDEGFVTQCVRVVAKRHIRKQKNICRKNIFGVENQCSRKIDDDRYKMCGCLNEHRLRKHDRSTRKAFYTKSAKMCVRDRANETTSGDSGMIKTLRMTVDIAKYSTILGGSVENAFKCLMTKRNLVRDETIEKCMQMSTGMPSGEIQNAYCKAKGESQAGSFANRCFDDMNDEFADYNRI